MIRLIETEVSVETLENFCKEADNSPMYMVRIYLH